MGTLMQIDSDSLVSIGNAMNRLLGNGSWKPSEMGPALNDIPLTEHPIPEISFDSNNGVIYASHTQEAGYLKDGGKKTAPAVQLETQEGKTVYPSSEIETAVEAGKYTLGAIKVAAIEEVEKASLELSVDSNAKVTAEGRQQAGYVSEGKITGELQLTKRGNDDLSVDGGTVTAPAGYYPSPASKTVSTVKQATPTVSVSSNGEIAVRSVQDGGYVAGGAVNVIHTLSSKDDIDFDPANIRDGYNIFGVSGSFTNAKTLNQGISAAGVDQILSGYGAWVNGEEVDGQIGTISTLEVSGNKVTAKAGYYATSISTTVGTALGAATYYPKAENQTIATGRYITGTQTFKSVITTNLSAENIKYGAIVKVGGTSTGTNVSSVTQITGTFTSANTSIAATKDDILSGKVAWVNGAKVTGSVSARSSSDATITGATVSFPGGIYGAHSGTVASGSAKTPATTVSITSPTISINTSAKKIVVTGSATKSVTPTTTAGYISSGTAGTITASVSGSKDINVYSTGGSIDGIEKTSYEIPGGYHTGTGSVTFDSGPIETLLAEI